MPTADHADISTLLKGKIAVGTRVTVRGWVRTRRDSKAGLSFIHVHDGSCFDPIQVVAPAQLPNYESDIKKLTSGCAVIARGTLIQSQGQGQAVEVQADAVDVLGWVDDPEAYPIQPKRASFEYLREVGTCARARTHWARSHACATVSASPSIATSMSAGSSGCIRPSSPRAMPRAPARCSG